MRNVIMSTENCYEAYNMEDDNYSIGSISELEEDENIDESTIEWNQSEWESEKDYFRQFVQYEIEEHEKETRSEVVAIGQFGTAGVWTGNQPGGRLLETNDIKGLLNMNVETIDVVVDENRDIFIEGHHHDGTHYMQIYFITEKDLKETNLYDEYEQYGANEIDNLAGASKLMKQIKPLKLRKNSDFFGV